MIERALQFAEHAHRGVGQKRKYTGEPYVVHPIEVMGLIVAYANFTYQHENVLVAALLHDVVEDTNVTLEQIEATFGAEVARFVDGLTDKFVSGYEENGVVLNRRQRKKAEAGRLSATCEVVQTIKCADLLSNSRTIVQFDPDFAKTYIPEKRAILEQLTKADRALWNAAMQQLELSEEILTALSSQPISVDS
jgi:(p)ppGpp synthase/HD superfamily hydrolase